MDREQQLIIDLISINDDESQSGERTPEKKAAKMLITLHRYNTARENGIIKWKEDALRREGAIEELRMMLSDGPLIPGAMTQYITQRILTLRKESGMPNPKMTPAKSEDKEAKP